MYNTKYVYIVNIKLHFKEYKLRYGMTCGGVEDKVSQLLVVVPDPKTKSENIWLNAQNGSRNRRSCYHVAAALLSRRHQRTTLLTGGPTVTRSVVTRRHRYRCAHRHLIRCVCLKTPILYTALISYHVNSYCFRHNNNTSEFICDRLRN